MGDGRGCSSPRLAVLGVQARRPADPKLAEMASFTTRFLGCKVSFADAQAVRERLVADGHVEARAAGDLAVVNTCCVTHEAVSKSRQALARAAAGERADVRFMTADAISLPFAEGLFDVVATNKTTHHVPQWSSALAEMRRVLKPNGYLLYADLTAPSWLAWLMKPFADRVGVFTGADLDRSFASLRRVHRTTGWVHYETTLQKP